MPKQAVINKIGIAIKRAGKKNHLSPHDIANNSICSEGMVKQLEDCSYKRMPILNALSSLETASNMSKGTLTGILKRAIGQRIKYLRNQHGLRQVDIAHRINSINMSKSHVEDLELGKSVIRPTEVAKLSHLFDDVDGNFVIVRTDKESVRHHVNVNQMSLNYRPQIYTKSNLDQNESHRKASNNMMNCLNLDISREGSLNGKIHVNFYNGNKFITSKCLGLDESITSYFAKIKHLAKAFNLN